MSTTVSVSNVQLGLAPHSSTEHALTIGWGGQEFVRVVGTVAQLRAKAQEGLGMSIPPLPREEAASTPSASSGDEDRFARIESAIERLTSIAEAAQRRGLI